MRRLARFAKTALGRMCGVLGLYRFFLRGYCVVLALHRVLPGPSEESMTLPAALFEDICRLLKKHLAVVSLDAVAAKLEHNLPFAGEAVITFDDGYRDAFTVAAPILESLGLTATFFLASGFVGSEHVPWWDEHGAVEHPFMDWDEARSLLDRGFSIGSHSRSHPDFGVIGQDLAEEELARSKAELEAGLDAPVTSFAFPYGEAVNMRDDNRGLVAKTGYRCCCGYGGLVEQGQDPFRLSRIPVSIWHSSAAHLGGDLVVRALRQRLRNAGRR